MFYAVSAAVPKERAVHLRDALAAVGQDANFVLGEDGPE
jgi:hypothetical protein